MLSKLFRNSVTSCRNASRSFATASSRALVSDGGGGEGAGDRPCCDRDLESPSATAEDMLCCWVPLVRKVGESGCSSSSTSSASRATGFATGC
jgi:hypothetical protein